MNRDSGNSIMKMLLEARKQLLDNNVPEEKVNLYTVKITGENYDKLSDENKEYIKRNFKSVNLVGD